MYPHLREQTSLLIVGLMTVHEGDALVVAHGADEGGKGTDTAACEVEKSI